MIIFNPDKCAACGKCVKDCVFSAINLKNGKAELSGNCIKCGHCVAICPTNAVSIPEYDMADVEDIGNTPPSLAFGNLLHIIKSRRSIRHFTSQPVEHDKLENIIQAGRYTATGVNRQSCRFIIVQKNLNELKKIIWNGIDEGLKNPDSVKEDMLDSFKNLDKWRSQGIDFLFRNAPVAIYIAADSVVDAALAAQNMELAAISQNLGILYNGYLAGTTTANSSACEMLDLQNKPIEVCMILGYPDVKYCRTAPRKKADAVWK